MRNFHSIPQRFRLAPCLFLLGLLLSGLPGMSQNSQDQIHLKRYTFTPDPATSLTQMAATPAYQYVILQFDAPPSSRDLARAGGPCLGKLSETAIYTLLPANRNLNTISNLRWAGQVPGLAKVTLDVEEALRLDPQGTHKFLVEFTPDLSTSEIDAIVTAAAGTSLAHPDLLPDQRLVQGNEQVFINLYSRGETEWVEVAPTFMITGQRFHRCPHNDAEPGECGYVKFVNPRQSPVNPRFVLAGEGWDGPGQGCADLKFFINQGGAPNIPGNPEEAEIIRALNEWAKWAEISFTRTTIQGEINALDFLWLPEIHGDGLPFLPITLLHTFLPPDQTGEPLAGDIHFNEDQNWYVRMGILDPNAVDVYPLTLHAIGHALGLDHSQSPGNVMSEFIAQDEQFEDGLAVDDVLGLRTLYSSGESGWVHHWAETPAPATFQVDGDIEVAPNGQVRYRDMSGRMVNVYLNNGEWDQVFIPNQNDPAARVRKNSAIATASGGATYYAGEDDNLQRFFWDNNQWNHEWVSPANDPNSLIVIGEIETAPNGDVFYESRHGRLVWNRRVGNAWVQSEINPATNPAKVENDGAIAVAPDGSIFYHGENTRIQRLSFQGGSWVHENISPGNAPEAHKIVGDLEVDSDGTLYYHGKDDQLQSYTFTNGQWVHGWPVNDLESFWKVRGDIEVAENGQIRYPLSSGTIANYYEPGGIFTRASLPYDWIDQAWNIAPHSPLAISPVNGETWYKGTDDELHYFAWETDICTGKKGNSTTDDVQVQGKRFSAYPTPFRDEVNFVLHIESDTPLDLTVVDLQGKVVKAPLLHQQFAPGTHQLQVSTAGLPAGVYFAVLTQGANRQVLKLAKSE